MRGFGMKVLYKIGLFYLLFFKYFWNQEKK
nr:MAG TPA: hypothetical protein [Caudoviricetes sp.]